MSEDDSQGGGARLARRLILKTLAAGAALFDDGCDQPEGEADAAVRLHGIEFAHELDTPITIENRLPGSADYALMNPALAGEVEGYASETSVAEGDTLRLFVNVIRAQSVRCDVYRLGYYQGLGARLVSAGAGVLVSPQSMPNADPTTGLMECQWQGAFALLVEASWLSGYYLCKLTNEDGLECHVPFIVRESGRTAPLLVQASVTTWQAYNTWTGLSLYVNEVPDELAFSGDRAFRVSFDRPYAAGVDIGGSVEYPLVRWLEQNGYDVSYVTNVDLDRASELLIGRKLFVTSGHDEYWSVNERDAVQVARDAGLSLAFFSGNTAYRRIRLESSSAGAPRRIVTCYKSASLDPHDNAPDTTANYADSPYPRPENELVGVLWAGWAWLQGYPLIVSNPDHWVYDGTGVQANDTIGHVVGYEWDIVSDNGVAPAGLEIVGDSAVLHEYGYNSRATAVVYYPTPNSFVFGAGTIGWNSALATPGLVDARLQRVSANILARAGLFPQASLVVPTQETPEVGTSPLSRVVAGSGSAGTSDGAALSAQFNSPGGIAAGPNGELYVSDTGNNLVRKIAANGDVSTILGIRGHAKTSLDTPTGIAVDASGLIYLSDSNNHRILTLDTDGKVGIFAGGTQGNSDNENPRKAEFNLPRGLAFDASGALYIADFRNDAIRRIDASGVSTVVSGAGGPTALAIDSDGTVYYLATSSGGIVRVSPDGTRIWIANAKQVYGDKGGPGALAQLRPAEGLCLTPSGLVFSDTGNNRMRRLAFDQQNTVSTLLGTGQAGAGSGLGADTRVVLPRGLTAFNGGYAVADSANHRILWFSA